MATSWEHDASYCFFSLPVLLGTSGGLLLAIGTSGLVWLNIASAPAPVQPELMGADFALLFLLLLTALTGLLLLGFRTTAAMGPLLAIHFGVVLALFVLLPYCKFVHAIYRFLALLRWAEERETGVASVPSHLEQRAADSENLRVALNVGPNSKA